MSVVLAALMVAVALYCASRMAVPRWRDDRHTVAADLTHVVMGSVMAVMFLAALPPAGTPAAIVAFAAAVVWFAVRWLRGRTRAQSLRIGATCLAMLFMLSPAAASAHPTAAGHAAGHPLATVGQAEPATLLATVVLFAMIAAVVDALLEFAGRPATLRQRLSTLCEVSMAGTMGCMLFALM